MASGSILSLKNQPDLAVVEAIVGDVIDCTVSFGASQTTTLTRKPAGSSATVSANAFTADVKGLFVVTVGWSEGPSRVVNFIAFPASVLTRKLRTGRTVDRTLLRGLCQDPRLLGGAGLTANINGSIENPGTSGDALGLDARMFGVAVSAFPLDLATYGEGA